MTAQELALLVRQCAVAAIANSLAALTAFRHDYTARIKARHERVQACQSTITVFPKSLSVTSLSLAATYLDTALRHFSQRISTAANAWQTRVTALPDTCVSLLSSMNLSLPPNLTSSTVCPKVDDALRPDLSAVADYLIKARAYFDHELGALDLDLRRLETALTDLKSELGIKNVAL